PAGEAEPMGLADHRIAGDAVAELLGNLACRLALQPEALQEFDAFLSPSHVVSHRCNADDDILSGKKYDPTTYSNARPRIALRRIAVPSCTFREQAGTFQTAAGAEERCRCGLPTPRRHYMVRPLLRYPGSAVSDFIREVDEDLRRENL